MNRAHGYKSIVDKNYKEENDLDKGVNMGLFSYPVLMTIDLCVFDSEYVFIGEDQTQHIEMAKEIVKKFNFYNTNILSVPKPIVNSADILLGSDGRKMSKSYNNIIPLFCEENELKKKIFSVVTNSKNVGESKGFDESPITGLYNGFANSYEIDLLKQRMYDGIGWGEVKKIVFDKINNEILEAREKYKNLNDVDAYEILDTCHFKINDKITEKMIEIKDIVYNRVI
jgi:tryptophanyl-tRNA synthetase